MTEDQKNMIDMVTALIAELEAEQKRHKFTILMLILSWITNVILICAFVLLLIT